MRHIIHLPGINNCLKGILFAILILLSYGSMSQNVAINTDGSKANPNAIVDIKSTNKGLLIPRMTTSQRRLIPQTNGLLVYDINTKSFWYSDGEVWKSMSVTDPSVAVVDDWHTTGNAGTLDGINFLGTYDNVPLNFRVNNQKAGRIDNVLGNAFFGYNAGFNNTSGYNNTFIGHQAGYSHTTKPFTTAVGYQALYANTVGEGNMAVGAQSLYSNRSGNFNTAIGTFAMFYHASGDQNTAVGYAALNANETGVENTAVGTEALLNNKASLNTAVGALAMFYTTTGGFNTALGATALHYNFTGSNNTALGYQALINNQSANDNTATGYKSLQNTRTGSGNTSTGYQALWANTSGYGNVGMGSNTLSLNTSGFYNTAVGTESGVAFDNLHNSTAIGYAAKCDASNKVRIGNAAVTVIEGQVPFTTPSDGRYKFNIRDDVKGLDFILQLHPVTYQFDVKRFDSQSKKNFGLETAYDEAAQIRRSGFIAQEVEKAAEKSGYNFSGIIKPKSENEHYSLSYESFVVPLVKAVQEQQQIINEQNKKIELLMQEIQEIKKSISMAQNK